MRAGTRPVWVAPAPNGSYLATYRDEAIGEWAARHGLDGTQYQAEFDQEVAAGLWPLPADWSSAWRSTRRLLRAGIQPMRRLIRAAR